MRLYLAMKCNHENEQKSHRTAEGSPRSEGRMFPMEEILKGQRITKYICFMTPDHSCCLFSRLATHNPSPFGSPPKADSCPPVRKERQNSFQKLGNCVLRGQMETVWSLAIEKHKYKHIEEKLKNFFPNETPLNRKSILFPDQCQ